MSGSSIDAGVQLEPVNMLDTSQVLLNSARQFATANNTSNASYSVSTTTSPPAFTPTSAPHYSVHCSIGRTRYDYADDRRQSHSLVPPVTTLLEHSLGDPQQQQLTACDGAMVDYGRAASSHHSHHHLPRDSFVDALDPGRGGMVIMGHPELSPARSIYASHQASTRTSLESYGYPPAPSPQSSVSSQSTYPTYYAGSVAESSVTDYSSASESLEAVSSRTLPPPSGLMTSSLPPAPQSMMGQFSSKVSTNSQKKHKCKICDKRFTRPSSLQTHMYSHTGQKPFACEVEGCGRHFSVVSNLRRHRKVHRTDRERTSPESR